MGWITLNFSSIPHTLVTANHLTRLYECTMEKLPELAKPALIDDVDNFTRESSPALLAQISDEIVKLRQVKPDFQTDALIMYYYNMYLVTKPTKIFHIPTKLIKAKDE